MSFSKNLKVIGATIGIFGIILSFQNCSNQSGSPGGSVATTNSSSSSSTRSSGMGSGTSTGSGNSMIPGGTTSNTSPIPSSTSDKPAIAIYCTSYLHELNSATCSTILSGNIVKGSWFVDGSEVMECRDQRSCTWNNVPAGIYKVKAIAYDSANVVYTSNEFTVQVLASTLTLATPATVYCNQAANAGQSATCAAIVAKDVQSGSWYVNGSKYLECENKRSCTWTNVPADTYSVHVVVNKQSGASYESAPFTLVVK